MVRRLFFIILFFTTPFVTLAQPKQIVSFESLVKLLNGGENVRVVIHFAKCQLIYDNEIQKESPDAISGLSIDTYEYFARNAVRGNEKAFLVFSENKLIQNPKGKGYVYNYGKVRIEEDGEVKITVSYIDPITLEETMTEKFFTTINDTKNQGGLFLYYEK
jgi:hypothetical protein